MAHLTRAWQALRAYLAQILVNLDCTAASVFLLAPAKTTITQMAWAARKAGRRWGCVTCKLLHLLDRNHCEKYGLPDQ